MIPILELFNEKSRFTVQLHKAEKAGEHFDLRVEYKGVMVSWATRKLDQITNGSKDKIVLYRTEDHDLKWHKWKGKIESGYGKGKVELWDSGYVDIIEWDINKKIILNFNGKKIKNKYAIIPYQKEKDSFLMVKTKR